MREIVIVISDLHLASDFGGTTSTAAAPALPGLQDAARFGQRTALEDGWRAWLARSIGRDDLARAATAAVAGASVAATGAAAAVAAASSSTAATAPAAATPAATPLDPSASGTVWIATPIHLIASLTSLHLDYRSLLVLPAEDLTRLAQDFTATFGNTDFHLKPTPSGALLLQSQAPLDVVTTEPSRALASELEASLPTGRDAPALKRLGAELEMWLHSHPLNEARARRGELPISTLWLWGGGPSLQAMSAPTPSENQPAPGVARPTTGAALTSQPLPLTAFGSDPYLAGLCHLTGLPHHPLPDRLPDPTQHPAAQRSVFVTEVTPLLHTNPHWTLFEALTHIDSRFIEPSMAALRRGSVDNVVVIANDTQLHIARRDRLRFWRARPKSGLAALRSLCR